MRCKTEQGKRPPASLSDHWSDETPGIVAPVARRAEFFGTLREMAVHAGAIRPDRIRLTAVTLGGGGSSTGITPVPFVGLGLMLGAGPSLAVGLATADAGSSGPSSKIQSIHYCGLENPSFKLGTAA